MMKYRCYILLSLVSGAFTKTSLRTQSKLAKCKRIFPHAFHKSVHLEVIAVLHYNNRNGVIHAYALYACVSPK